MRCLLLLVAIAAGLPCLAQSPRPQTRPAASQPTVESLQRQIAQLNQIIAGLQDRVNALAGQVRLIQQAMGQPVPTSQPAQPADPKAVKEGMTLEEIKRVRGEPSESTTASGGLMVCKWYEYSNVVVPDPPPRYEGTQVDTRRIDVTKNRPPDKRRMMTRSLTVIFRQGRAVQIEDTIINPPAR